MKSLINQKFNRLTVIEKTAKRTPKGEIIYKCVCDCGNFTETYGGQLKHNKKMSCGCLQIETRKLPKHGPLTHGATSNKKLTDTYKSWLAMKRRCTDPKCKDYERYRKNNITLDPRWLSFSNFLEDMGNRPINFTIDRIDNNKGYSKKNCRWANRKTQSENSSRVRLLTFNGQTKSVSDWAKHIGISRAKLSARINTLHWSIKKSLET